MNQKIGRNGPCPCGSGIKYKKCCLSLPSTGMDTSLCIDEDGLHSVHKGTPPSIEEQEKMTREYQNNIRKSPLWSKMVKEYGEEKAKEMLNDFRLKIGW
jgi:hypothetical protein